MVCISVIPSLLGVIGGHVWPSLGLPKKIKKEREKYNIIYNYILYIYIYILYINPNLSALFCNARHTIVFSPQLEMVLLHLFQNYPMLSFLLNSPKYSPAKSSIQYNYLHIYIYSHPGVNRIWKCHQSSISTPGWLDILYIYICVCVLLIIWYHIPSGKRT